MAYTIELVGRKLGGGDPPSGTQRWQVRDVLTEDLAYALLNASTPATWHGLLKQRLRVEEIDTGIWRGEATYGTKPPIEAGQATLSFESAGGGHVHISQSLSTYSKTGDPNPAPDFKGTLNVRETGDGLVVDGLDIDTETFNWSETHYILAASLTQSYLDAIRKLYNKINNDTFRIFSPGEVQFKGITGQMAGYTTRQPEADEVVPVTFNFSASSQASNIPVGDITVPFKEGWHYLWVFYKDVEDTGSYDLVKQPRGAYVEKIFHKADFGVLNIPSPWPCGV